MRCADCGADSPADVKFCGHCGALLPVACHSCGAANPPEHKFCGQCGAPLGASGLHDSAARLPYRGQRQAADAASGSLPGEIKQVTVLFCDIVNSTPLAERLGPEAMRDLVNRFLEASLAEVSRYGGTTPQFTGDGFMALFGAPLTYEDHVRRALLAALAIRRAVGEGALGGEGAAGREAEDLSVRIGVHSGPVVFGPVAGNLAMDYTAIGDTANVAARLQQAAMPGTVVISETTRLLAQGYARVEPIGPLSLKGKAEPTLAYSLLGISHRRSGLRESMPPRSAAFVDRDGELAILSGFLRQAESGRGQAVGLVGEPGIGKSRVLVEFRRQLGDEGLTWMEGRCLSYGTQIPYMLALDTLRSNCGIGETDNPDIIVEKVRAAFHQVGMDPEEGAPVLLHLLEVKEIDPSPALSVPDAVKNKAFAALRQLCLETSRIRPLILVLEDLHWIDKMSEEFVGFLAESIRDARILLLGTYRPGYRPPWIEKSYASQIPMQPLSHDDSLQIVRSVFRTERLVELVTQEIVAKADGNPLFLEQLALHAGEATDLRSGLAVPDTIHDVVMARIDRLPEQAKRLLQIAAVIGREFPLPLLRAVWRGPRPVEPLLREMERLEFVHERIEAEGSVYIFRHALTQETAYGSLLERHRRAYHSAVGQALEQLHYGRADEVAELMALHFGRSDEAEKAVDYAILAAEKAQRRWANNDALAYFNDALRRLDQLPDAAANRERRIDAVLKQGDGKFALGKHAEHIEALDQIRDLIEQMDDPRRRATWHYWRGFAGMLTGGRPDIAIEHCNKAISLAAAGGLSEIESFAQSCLAQGYLIAGRLREAIESGERALMRFEATGNLWWAGRTISHLSPAAIALGEWERSLGYCRRAIAHGETLNDVRLRIIGLWRMGITHIQQGDPDRGVGCCNQALGLGPSPYDTATARAARGYGEIKAGRIDEGISDLADAVAWLEQSGLRYPRWRFSFFLAEGHLRRGDRTAARALVEGILEPSRAMGYLPFQGLACWLMGECLAPDDAASAEPYIAAAIEILEQISARNDLARAMVTRAALRQTAGDPNAARELLDGAEAIFKAIGSLDEPCRVEAARAALARGAPIPLLAAAS